MVQTTKTDVLLDGLSYPEAPRWRNGKLWFSDFYLQRVMTLDLNGNAEIVVAMDGRPSGLGWTRKGELLVVSMLDRHLLRLEDGHFSTMADLSAFATGPLNDMVVDTHGRAYVGNFGFDPHRGEQRRNACLARVDPDGSICRAADELVFPNGMVITPDAKTLIVAESTAFRLTAFDISADGALSNRHIFAELDKVCPDGICLDAEGAIWVANCRGNTMVRVFEGGRVERTIHTGERMSSACMLGGADRQTLFMLTNTGSGVGMAQKRDGRIEILKVDVPGVGLP